MSSNNYVLFGYCLDDEDKTAFFGENLKLVSDIHLARRFPSKKKRGQKGFGTPNQWLDLINSESDINQGYKFHLVPVIN